MTKFLNLDKNFVAFVLTGAITGGVLQVTQLDVSYSLLYDIWSKSIKQTFLAPVTQYDYIIGSWLIGMARGLTVFVILSFFSAKLFGFIYPGLIISIIFLTGIFLTGLMIGMFVCLLVMLYGQRVEVTAWSLVALLMLVCGMYYPVNLLPKPFVIIAAFIPLTHFLEYYRSFYGFSPVFTYSLIKGFVLVIFYIILLFILLKYAFEHSRRTGMILRLSE
jgi:ABC-2 type transport system permease protein